MRRVLVVVLWLGWACSTDTTGLREQPVDTSSGGSGPPRASPAAGSDGDTNLPGSGSGMAGEANAPAGFARTRLSVFNGLHEVGARLLVCEERGGSPWPAPGLERFRAEELPRDLDEVESDLVLHFFAAIDSPQPPGCEQLLSLPRQPQCPSFEPVPSPLDAGFSDAGTLPPTGQVSDAGTAVPHHRLGALSISPTSLAAGWSHVAVASGCADPCSLDSACDATSLFGTKSELTLVAFGNPEASGTRLQVLHAAPGVERAEVNLVPVDSAQAPLSLGGGLELGALRPRSAAVFADGDGLAAFAEVELRVAGQSEARRWSLSSIWQSAGLAEPPSSGEHLMILAGSGPVTEDLGPRLGWVVAPL